MNKKIEEILNQFAANRRGYAVMTATLKKRGGTVEGLKHLKADAEDARRALAGQLSEVVEEEKERLQHAAFCAPADQKGDYRLAAARLILLDSVELPKKFDEALRAADTLAIRAIAEMSYQSDWTLFQQVADCGDTDLEALLDFEKTWGALRSEKTRLNIAAATALVISELAEVA
jgi:hypothetical protein